MIRLVLAEDHETVRDGLKLLIAAQPDMQVIGEAANGRMALQLAHELRPTVLVLDVSMPEMTGSMPSSSEGRGVKCPICWAQSWSTEMPPTLISLPGVLCTGRPVRKLAVLA